MQKLKSEPRAVGSLVYLLIDVVVLIEIFVSLGKMPAILDQLNQAKGLLPQQATISGIMFLFGRAVVLIATLALVGKEWWLKNRQIAYTINRRVFESFLFLFLLWVIVGVVCALFMPLIHWRLVP